MIKRKPLVDELVEYVKNNLKKGYTKDSLRWALVGQGYSKLEVERALKIVDQKLAEEAPVLKTKPDIKYEVVEPKEYATKPWWKKILGI